MLISGAAMTRGRAAAPILGALGAMGLTVALLTRRRSKPRPHRQRVDRRSVFATYLRDHLAGADAAIQIVERLRETHRSVEEGALFAFLFEQLCADREVVEALLADLDASPVSIKRLAGRAAGKALRAATGGESGDLSLFRTLEALAIGVQGKRCLWRAAQELSVPVRARGRRTFLDLEADAVRQWEAIEQYRLSLVPRTFAL